MNLDTSEHPTFHVDQSGQCNSVDDPDFPSRCDTDGMIADLIAGMNQIKWGENKKKAFMNAEHVRHLVGCLQGKPGFTWKDPQEKHTTRRDYRVDGDGHLCNSSGQKIIVREQIHDILVFLHGLAKHYGRDGSIAKLENHYKYISRKGITKKLMSQWIIHLCPRCRTKPKQLGPKAKTGKSPKGTKSPLVNPNKSRVAKKQAQAPTHKPTAGELDFIDELIRNPGSTNQIFREALVPNYGNFIDGYSFIPDEALFLDHGNTTFGYDNMSNGAPVLDYENSINGHLQAFNEARVNRPGVIMDDCAKPFDNAPALFCGQMTDDQVEQAVYSGFFDSAYDDLHGGSSMFNYQEQDNLSVQLI